MDRFNRKIISALQLDSSQPIAALAESIGLSTSACHRRVRALQESGVIVGYAARIDRNALGLSLLVFVEISLSSQALEVLEAFEFAVQGYDDILECHLTSGEADYVLRVVARDMEDYAHIHRHCLARLPHVSSMHTIFTLRPVKACRGYRVPAAAQG